MSDNHTDPSAVPQVQDKRTRPLGVVPKNMQTWVVLGITVLMVLAISLSGKNAPKKRAAETPPPVAVDANAALIEEYRRRLDEETHRLQNEQAQVARTRASFAPGAQAPLEQPNLQDSRAGYLGPDNQASSQEENRIAADKIRREYQSLFATNVALSYRPNVSGVAHAATKTPGSAEPDAPALGGSSADKKEEALKDAPHSADSKQYRLFEGTVLETVLTNRLDGDFSGPANCMLTTSVYSHDGQHLLIPQGSRMLGEVRKVETFGEKRLALVYHRLIMPDGYSISLDKLQGLSQTGETGLVDQVNHHYLQIFGVSLAIGAIAGLSQANTQAGFNESAADAYRQGVASSLSQSSLHILDRYLNVLPTFTIREGQRVKVYLSSDLLLPAYEKHQIPSDL